MILYIYIFFLFNVQRLLTISYIYIHYNNTSMSLTETICLIWCIPANDYAKSTYLYNFIFKYWLIIFYKNWNTQLSWILCSFQRANKIIFIFTNNENNNTRESINIPAVMIKQKIRNKTEISGISIEY